MKNMTTVIELLAGLKIMWLLNLDGQPSLLHSWTICSAGIFVLVALVLSMYLIFEHLAAYNIPEVCSVALVIWTFVLVCTERLALLHHCMG